MEWTKVEDGLPEDFKRVWVITDNEIWIASHYNGKWNWAGHEGWGKVIAWKPLKIPRVARIKGA